MRVWLSIGILVGALHSASAQRANDEAIALALFNEGRALAKAGDLVHACPKFEAADRLTGWLGVELNLADCYAGLGRTASAWVLFRKAADKAEITHDERAAYARSRAAQLEPALARLKITAAMSPAEVRLDDVVLTGDMLGSAVPVDPGDHHLQARLPGASERWSRDVHVTPGALLTVQIPAPVRLRDPVPAPAREPHQRPWLAWSLGGMGTAMIATSLGLGISAKLRYDEALADHCDVHGVCGPAGIAEIASARQQANAATILGGVGVTLAAAGLMVYVVAHDHARRVDHPPRLSVVPMATSEALGVSIGGSL
jgi:hypothetical protein